ncbi:glutamyl-tRNA reductase [Proteinivorax tanatarense]|uniref:Glutamyl-tRNA reductase n=1 Tax=Proteinivorax tanatarense TaxID=1260629 RepID=A0AAU7VK46_9FIRM
MSILVFSINHKKSNIEFREKVAFKNKDIDKVLEIIKKSSICKEGVILSTCNRTELIGSFDDLTLGEKWCKKIFYDTFSIAEWEMAGKYEFKKNDEAIFYLYRLCCGLESIVLGEDQILGQVKKAHEKAMEKGASGKILNKLFLGAVTAAKDIRSNTKISENPLSLSYIAVKQAQKKLGSLKNSRALVVGYGKMSRLTVTHLLELGVREVYICNRSPEKVKTNKSKEITSVSYKEKYDFINKVDIIISATSAPHYIYHYNDFEKTYRNNPIVLIDIAIPRDIDPRISNIQGASLYHIDNLKEIAQENIKFREKLLNEISREIETRVNDFIRWRRSVPIHSKIAEIHHHNDLLVDEGLEQMFKKIDNLNQRECKIIEETIKSMVKRMWKKPIIQMKYASEQGDCEEALEFAKKYLGCKN